MAINSKRKAAPVVQNSRILDRRKKQRFFKDSAVSKLVPAKKGEFLMKYGYVRVSSTGQARDGNSLEAQEKLLRENGAEVIYKDVFTGTEIGRPEFQRLLAEVKPGDTILATKLDRVSRSASQGIALVDELIAKGVTLHILNMGPMNDSPTGKLIRNIMFSFAEFERDMIVERMNEGKSIARANNPNYKEGRKRKFTEARLESAMALLKTHSYREVEKMTGISKSTLIRERSRRNTEGTAVF